jgi:ATP-dependent Clp protease ATP-binding subunit ClpB
MNILKSKFRPELINRIDEIVIFNSLSKDVIYEVLDRLIEVTNKNLENVRLHVKLSDKAKNKIIDDAYTPEFGARPIKRYVTKNIETLIAESLLEEKIHQGDKLLIDYDNQFIIKEE